MLIFTPFATMESESFVNNSDLHHFGSFVSWSPARQARAQKQQQQVRPLTPFPLLLLCSISFPCPIWLDFSLMTTSFQPKCHDQMERLWPGMKMASSMAKCVRRSSSRSPFSSFDFQPRRAPSPSNISKKMFKNSSASMLKCKNV